MASFWSRKDKHKGGLPPPPASQAVDLGMLMQERGPKPRVAGDPEEQFAKCCWIRRAGRQLRRALLGHVARPKDGSKQRRASRGAEESRRATGMRAQAARGCAELEGKALGLPEEPGTRRKATRGGEAPQEEQVMVNNVHDVVPRHGAGGWDEPIVRRDAQDGVVPRGGGGHGDDTGQTRPLVQAGSSRDEEGRTTGWPQSLGLWVEDEGAATVPRGDWDGDRDRQDFNSPLAEGRSGEERRRRVWEKLRRLGEDMAAWEGRSTRDLAARLVEVILQTGTKTYPTETGNDSARQEQGRARARVGSSEGVGALVDTHADVTMAQQRPQDLAVCRDIPVSIGGTVCGGDGRLPAVLEPSGKEQIREDSGDNLLEQGGPLARPRPAAVVCCLVMTEARSKEQWREEFPGVWAQHKVDCGLVSGEEEVHGAPVPFRPQRPLPADVEEVVASTLWDLLREGVVVEGCSSSNSPLRPVPKADGKTWRLTLDCRAVNRATPRVAPVVLDVARLVTSLSPESKSFSTVDLSNASFAVPLAAGSRARFAFTFGGRQYLFTRLPPGFHSTTSIVHRRVAQMLSQLPQGDRRWVFSYVDDILIAGKSPKETEARTRRVLKLIQETGFKAKLEKAQLVQPEVDYLGMTLGPEGRRIQASKREALSKAPSPRDARGLRSLLGKFGSLQDHIPGYWALALPLHRLAAERGGWAWGPAQERALSRLKRAVLAAPALRFPDGSRPFVIRPTAGGEAAGAALLQEDERGRLVPVGHSSRVLKKHEVSHPPEEKGCLAAAWAVQAFQTLTGPAPALLQMSHSPGKYLLRGEALGSSGTGPRPAQWTLLLVNGGAMARGPQPERGEPPGTLVPSAPPLWQLPSCVPKANVWFMASERARSIGFAAASLEERWLLGVAEGDSVLGAELVALQQLLLRHRCSAPLYLYTGCWPLVERLGSQVGEEEPGPWASSGEGLWPSILGWVRTRPGVLHVRYVGVGASEDAEEAEWRQRVGRRARAMAGSAAGSRLIWEPSKYERQEIVAQCHGRWHKGAEGTLARVRRVAPWEGDRGQVARWVRSCLQCGAGRDGAGRVPPQRAEGPWSQLWLGYVGGLPESEEGHRSLLVVEDEFSGWVEAFPVRARAAEAMAQVLLEEVLARHGTPRAIRVPPCLRGAVGMAAAGLEPPWDIPQPGQAAPATAALRRLAQGTGKEWAKLLPVLVAGIRSVRAQGAVLSPFQIAHGFPVEMRWGSEGEVCPQDNVLPWLSRLQGDPDGYKHRIEAALLGGCPEGDALCP